MAWRRLPLDRFDIRNAKSRTKPYELTNSGGPVLRLQPNGGKPRRLNCRRDSLERSLSFGPYPTFSLSDARSKRT
jgi:hypothetical protein